MLYKSALDLIRLEICESEFSNLSPRPGLSHFMQSPLIRTRVITSNMLGPSDDIEEKLYIFSLFFDRFKKVLDPLIKSGDLPAFEAYTNEKPSKQKQRKRKVQKLPYISHLFGCLC